MKGVLVVFVFFLMVLPANAYVRSTFALTEGVKSSLWQSLPVRWSTTTSGSADVEFGELYRTLNHSFGRWENVTLASIGFSYQGNATSSIGLDGVNLIAFDEDGSLLSQGSSTLATTQFFISASTGRLLDADIVFNGRYFTFSTTGGYDIESIATHEIGHLIGLDHAILGTELETASRPSMTPYYIGTDGRTLEQDDRAGIGAVYPGNIFAATGNVTGNVRNGQQEIFGAYVAALNASTNKPVVAVLTGYSTGKGVAGESAYEMLGLEPGLYTIKATPMNGFNGVSQSNFNGIFSNTFATGFRTQYHDNVFRQSNARNVTILPNSALTASFTGNVAGVNASATQDQTVAAGTGAQYSVFIGNIGNDYDNLTVAMVRSDANATLNQTLFSNIVDGEQRTARLTIGSDSAGIFQTTVNVTSQLNASAGATISVITTFIANLSVSLVSPKNNTFTASSASNHTCNATGAPLQSMTFVYGSGNFISNFTVATSGTTNQTIFTALLPDGRWIWNCMASDAAGNTVFASENFTITIDTSPPKVYSINLNSTYVKPNTAIAVNVNASDGITGIANISINGTSLSGNMMYTGTIIASTSQGSHTITLTAVDAMNNTGANITSYVVDAKEPVITLFSQDTIRNANATLLWQVADANLSATILSIDDIPRAASPLNKTLEVQNFSALVPLLRSGMHKAVITAIDNASNIAAVTFNFTIFHEENMEEITNQLITAGRGHLSNVVYRDLSGNVISAIVPSNQTIIRDFVINSSIAGVGVSVNITTFGEHYDETKAASVGIEAYRFGTLGSMVGSHLSGNPPAILVMFQNMSSYIANYSLQNGTLTFVTMTFTQPLGRMIPYYMADDDGTQLYLLGQCSNNLQPTGIPSLSTICYTNSSTTVTLYLPHLSGGGLDDPSNAPTIALTTPGAIVNNSFIAAKGTILDLNLDAGSCTYNLTNGSNIVNQSYFVPQAESITNYTFSIDILGLANGTAYNLTISCKSIDNNQTTIARQFLVEDTIPPQTIYISTAGASSSTTAGTLTVTYTTDEAAVCGYNSTAQAADLLSFSQTDINLTQTGNRMHMYSKEYSSDGALAIPSVICIDAAGNSQRRGNDSFPVSVTVSRPRSNDDGNGRGGGGGGGGGKATAVVNSPARITKTAANIAKGQTAVLSTISKEMPLTQLSFTATEFIARLVVIAVRLVDHPADAPKPDEKVYEYLNITTIPEIKSNDIKLELRVAKEWMSANQISEMHFYMLEKGAWVQLSLNKAGESNVQIMYTATIPHLSLFALAGLQPEKKGKFVNQTEIQSEQSQSLSNTNESIEMTLPDNVTLPTSAQTFMAQKPNTQELKFIIIITTIIAVLSILSCYKLRHKPQPRSERIPRRR